MPFHFIRIVDAIGQSPRMAEFGTGTYDNGNENLWRATYLEVLYRIYSTKRLSVLDGYDSNISEEQAALAALS